MYARQISSELLRSLWCYSASTSSTSLMIHPTAAQWFFLCRFVTLGDTERCGLAQSPQRRAGQPTAHQAS
jgi:hypothetical protein